MAAEPWHCVFSGSPTPAVGAGGAAGLAAAVLRCHQPAGCLTRGLFPSKRPQSAAGNVPRVKDLVLMSR